MQQAIPPHLPSFIQAIAPTVNHYGYLAVAGFIFLEDFGTPFVPGETILISAAVFAGFGRLNIILVILIAFVAALIGDNVGFAIGDFGGRPLVERFGKFVLITPKRLDKAEAFFSRNGGRVVVIARFIDGLRQANGIVAGLSDMRWSVFVIYNAIGAALWVSTWSMVGYFGGSYIETIYKYGLYVSGAAFILLITYIVYRVLHKRRDQLYKH